MNAKENRIAAFIESLPMEAQLGECQSALLPTDMDSMGGGTNVMTCVNSSPSCASSTNKDDCTNKGENCTDAYNEKNCKNPPVTPVKPPTEG